MGRLLRARLKSLGVRKESYLFIVTCSSVILYVICLYTLIHINNSSGGADEGRRVVNGQIRTGDSAGAARWQRPQEAPRSSGAAFNWRSHFDDGKIHEFERNLAKPVDWDIAVKKKGVEDIAGYLRNERDKREKLETQQHHSSLVPKRGPPKSRVHQRALLTVEESDGQADEAASDPSQPVKPDPLFPADIFTKEQLKHGAVILHFIGVIYMFVALAIVCDEFFVPSLDVIIEKLNIPDDVAGATFMAAGGSAPELFTSVMGVFVSFDDVGIGTIVGSAVFNILFVIGMCALFSKTVLTLTWWPLFRDCTFYSISLITLILFFTDDVIYLWEAVLLLSIYALYVLFMRFNETAERAVKKLLYRGTLPRVSSSDQLVADATARGPPSQASVSTSSACGSTATTSIYPPIGNAEDLACKKRGNQFRQGILRLMIQSIDPFNEGEHLDEKANNLHAVASLRVLLDVTRKASTNDTEGGGDSAEITELTSGDSSVHSDGRISENAAAADIDEIPQDSQSESSDNEPLNLSWPQGFRKQITYLLLIPILFPLWLTLPDTRNPRGKRYFVVTFLGSIIWIALFSYLMVWWANVTGDTINIPPEVMGLTFLAAGTSIPDLITSVIVARKGFGDMAVSSSVGSNIFDVCVGLPLPWLLYNIIRGEPVKVSSSGMACSVLILFAMLVFVVLSIAAFRWKMNKTLGITMFFFYFLFVAVSLTFEYGYLSCPF